MKQLFEIAEVCPACKGTGLYVGMAERDGAAVVCHDCKGTGCHRFRHEYEVFTGRNDAPEGVRRVYQVNPGICIGGNLTDFGGMPLKEWELGSPFAPGMEDRIHACPAWFYQFVDYKKKPNWDVCRLGMFSACPGFKDKKKCWERWDKEYAK